MPRTYKQKYAYEVDYICDKCGEGKLRSNGVVLTSYPAQYPHVCEKCGDEQLMKNSYPQIEFRDYQERMENGHIVREDAEGNIGIGRLK